MQFTLKQTADGVQSTFQVTGGSYNGATAPDFPGVVFDLIGDNLVQSSDINGPVVLPKGTTVLFLVESLVATADAGHQAILDAIAADTGSASGTFPAGTTLQFPRNQVPIGWPVQGGSEFVTTGGIATPLNAVTSNGAGYGSCAMVTEGTAPGVWRLLKNVWQRFSLDTGAASGPSYSGPVAAPASGSPSFCVAIGKFIYYGGLVTSGGAATNGLYRFDTETGVTLALASFPKTLGSASAATSALALPDGRIIATSVMVNGAAQTQAATSFFLYDPATNQPPTEVVVNLPITKFAVSGANDNAPRPWSVLPNGEVLLVDATNPVANRLSCRLTIAGNTITASATEDTGFIGSASVVYCPIPTDTGAAAYGASRAYSVGGGWIAATAYPWVYGSTNGSSIGAQRVPGVGYLLSGCYVTGGGGMYANFYFSGNAAIGNVLVLATKPAEV